MQVLHLKNVSQYNTELHLAKLTRGVRQQTEKEKQTNFTPSSTVYTSIVLRIRTILLAARRSHAWKIQLLALGPLQIAREIFSVSVEGAIDTNIVNSAMQNTSSRNRALANQLTKPVILLKNVDFTYENAKYDDVWRPRTSDIWATGQDT